LLVAIGVTPNVELARSGGLKVNRGIVVSSRMETSSPGVYACGDCIEMMDFAIDSSRPIPTWPAAYAGGRVAGLNMAGSTRESDGTTFMNSAHIFGLPLMTIGRANPREEDGCEVLAKFDESGPSYRKVVLSGGRIVGALLMNEVDGAGVILSLIRKKADVTAYKEELLKGDFGLACVPRPARENVLGVHLNGAIE
jgi:NAD(P)H-nitrite reductase large subunit